MSYIGEYCYNLDSANRLILPSSFREQLGSEIILYRSIDGCLFVYDKQNFEKVIAPLKDQTKTPQGRLMVRRFYSDVSRVSMDRTGRLVVPAECIAHAGLKDEVTVLGADNRIEIWDKATFAQVIGKKDELPEDEYPDLTY